MTISGDFSDEDKRFIGHALILMEEAGYTREEQLAVFDQFSRWYRPIRSYTIFKFE